MREPPNLPRAIQSHARSSSWTERAHRATLAWFGLHRHSMGVALERGDVLHATNHERMASHCAELLDALVARAAREARHDGDHALFTFGRRREPR